MKKEKLCIGKWLLACVLLPACAWAGTGRPRACPAAGAGSGTAAESLHTPEPAVVPPLRGPHPEKQARTEAASGSGKRAGDRPEHRENGKENKMITRTEPRTGIGTGDGSENGPRPVRQRASLSVNLADCLDLFTFNMEAGTPVSARWSLTAGFRYNPWTFRRNREGAGPFQRRVLSVRTGVRFWPWHVHSGWFAGSSLGWERYNRGGLFGKKKTVEGDWYGLALSAGYALMLTRHLNLEFGLGITGGSTGYRVYACPRCGEVLKEERKIRVYPDNLLIQLSYLF